MTRLVLRPNNQPAWRMWVLKDGKLHAPFAGTPADSSTLIAECRHGNPWPRRCVCAIYYMPTVESLAALGKAVDEAVAKMNEELSITPDEFARDFARDYALTLGFPIGQWREAVPKIFDHERQSEGYRLWKIYVNAHVTEEDRRGLAERYGVPVVTGDLSAASKLQLKADARQMSRELGLSATTNTQNLRSLAAGLSSLAGPRFTARPR